MRTVVRALIWFPVAVLGGLASLGVLLLATAADLRNLPLWIAWALNTLPAFGCGVVCYYRIGRRDRARDESVNRKWRHLGRMWPLYLIGLLLILSIWRGSSLSDFGLVEQLFVWPLATTAGDIGGDWLAEVRNRQPSIPAAAT